MTTVALFGAGGKMGCRITDNLKDLDYDMRSVSYTHLTLPTILRV